MLIIGLSACVTPSVTQIDIDQDLLAIHSWDIKGRVGITTEDESWQLRLFWRQHYEDYELRFVAPFGQKTYLFKGGQGYVEMQSSDGQVHQGQNLESLIEQHTGWQIPVYSLRYWIKGLPDPALRVDKAYKNKDGQISQLQQSGWTILFKSYKVQDGVLLPNKVFFNHENVKLRLAISQWHVKNQLSKTQSP